MLYKHEVSLPSTLFGAPNYHRPPGVSCNLFHAVFPEIHTFYQRAARNSSMRGNEGRAWFRDTRLLAQTHHLLVTVQSLITALPLLFQIIQELEKQRIEVLCNVLNRYSLHMSSFGQTLKHVRPAHKYALNPSMDIITYILLPFPGPKTDRTDSQKGGHG